MEKIEDKSNKGMPKDAIYDFNNERLILKVFGGFVILRKPLLLHILNILLILFVLFLYSYIAAMALITIVALQNKKLIMIQAFYSLGSLIVAISLSGVKIFTENTICRAAELIRHGIFHYHGDIESEYLAIRRSRVSLIRYFVAFITVGLFCTAFTNVVLVPLMRFLTQSSNSDSEDINPYLPFPLLSPFNTDSFPGYGLAYLSNAFTIFFMYSSFACHEETYLSCAIQLGAEFEVLNHSLRNIHRRAYMKMKRNAIQTDGDLNVQNVYSSPEFQRCLYICLRENALHHLAIMRTKKILAPYMETTNLVAVLFISILVATAIFIFIENPKSQLTLITDVFGFLPMCYSGQVVIDESAEIKNALYATPWTHCNKQYNLLLKIMLSNTQEPVILKTRIFNVVLCLETFANMFSAGYKILNVIR